MAKFVNLMGDARLTRKNYDAFTAVNYGDLNTGDEIAITFGLNVETGQSAVNLLTAPQSSVEKDVEKTFLDNPANGDAGVRGYMGSQYLPALSNGLFEQGLDLVEDPESEPLIWVATEYFSLANSIKNKLMILPLDEGFLVCLQEGVISFPQDSGDDLVLARNIGDRDVDNMTFMTSSVGNIQGIPDNEMYNQSFLSVTLERKIAPIIARKSARKGNTDKGLSTSVAFNRFGTVLLDGGKRLKAQVEADKAAEEAVAEAARLKAERDAAAELRREAALVDIVAVGDTSAELRERAANQLAEKGHRNPFAEAFLNAQLSAAK